VPWPVTFAGLGSLARLRLRSPGWWKIANSTCDFSRTGLLHPRPVLAGLAGTTAARDADVLVDGYAYGSLSMTAYTLGLPVPIPPTRADPRGQRRTCHPTGPTSDPHAVPAPAFHRSSRLRSYEQR
jgi:hypothetical protein